ncbi:MAG: hypothetical protein MI866_06015 [Bacteroidales bacterium]|nr:hypothetical protein [Bacteroidales bacterium]
MALEEFEPKHTFTYNPNQTDSIRKALQQYANWVLTGEAFNEYGYCVAIFNPETKYITLNDFEHYPVIHNFLKKESERFGRDNLKECLLTETLLFAFALRHPELTEEIVKTSRAFVTYARALNDSSKMWITCEAPFALNPLLLLAYVYPQYGYLLTAFYVPHWDEHMGGALFSISSWIMTLGISRDTIKAFCYCDNETVRELMLCHDSIYESEENLEIKNNFDLISYFRESKEHFQLFLDLLVQRYNDMPYLPPYAEDYCITEYSVNWDQLNPIADLVKNMMFVHYPYNKLDDFDFSIDNYFTQTFLHKSAEDEISEIKHYIEQKLGHLIVNKNVFKNNKALLHPNQNH